MATSPPLSSPSLSSNAHFSAYTNGHAPTKPRTSNASSSFRQDKAYPASITSGSTPEVQINGRPRHSRPSTSSASASTHTQDETTWGSNFWVTLVDPQVGIYILILPLLFAALIDVCSAEPGVLLCVPRDGTGFMGPSRWKFCVRTFMYTLSDILPHGVKTVPDYRPVRMASGGRLATSRVAVFHTITTRRLAKLCGRNQMVLSYR